MLNVWGRIAFFILLAAFFVSCNAKAEDLKPEMNVMAPADSSPDPLHALGVEPAGEDEEPLQCEHYCKINLDEESPSN